MRCLVPLVASLAVMLSACGKPPSEFIDGFEPAPLQDGYTRFVTPIVHDIQPGADVTYCQWVKAPADHDILVLAFAGSQSKWGHHVILFSDTATYPVGESHECKSTDMPSVRFLGGSGGEGVTQNGFIAFPDKVVTKIPAGSAIMASTHFINASAKPIDGQGVVDLKLLDARDASAAQYTIAGFISNISDGFEIPPNASGTADANCVVKKDMSFFTYGNHMHEWGTAAYTELIHAADQSKLMMRSDPTWKPEYATHPNLSTWPLDGLVPVKAGDTLHTHCEWTNTTSTTITFPREMCVGFGFFLPSSADITCSNGVWLDQ